MFKLAIIKTIAEDKTMSIEPTQAVPNLIELTGSARTEAPPASQSAWDGALLALSATSAKQTLTDGKRTVADTRMPANPGTRLGLPEVINSGKTAVIAVPYLNEAQFNKAVANRKQVIQDYHVKHGYVKKPIEFGNNVKFVGIPAKTKKTVIPTNVLQAQTQTSTYNVPSKKDPDLVHGRKLDSNTVLLIDSSFNNSTLEQINKDWGKNIIDWILGR